jgi:hypothetical protein
MPLVCSINAVSTGLKVEMQKGINKYRITTYVFLPEKSYGDKEVVLNLSLRRAS